MKKEDVPAPDAPDLMAEACAWLARLETGKLSSEDRAAFREWVQRSPRHYAEIRRLAELSKQMNVLAGMAGPLRAAAKPGRHNRQTGKESRGRSAFWRWGALGVAGSFVVAVAILTRVDTAPPAQTETIHLATTIGETQDIALEDGSSVKLNTDSRIEVEFASGSRSVILEKGEAFFDVAHDPGRPFTVYAGDRSITAVGTAFSVRWIDEELSVTVSEGRVAYDKAPARAAPDLVDLLPASSQPASSRILGAGEKLEVASMSREEVVETLPENVLSRKLAWRSGFLDFDDAPLGEVVKELQRYTPERILVADQSVADLRFGGVVRIGQTEAFFEALELSFGVEVERTSDNQYVLKSVD